MNSFRFGLWLGFVAGIVFAALWNSEPEWDSETIVIVEESPEDIEIVEITATESPAE